MIITLDASGGLPLHAQIAAAIRRAVADGGVAPGDRLPAARILARSLQVNVHTVLRAYGRLRDEGLIELRRGRGATVCRGATAAIATIRTLAAELSAKARHQGLSQTELMEIIKEEFS